MSDQKSRYLNLFSDRAFKTIFGSEENKDLTLSLLNAILDPADNIASFEFVNTSYAARNPDDRGIAVDLQCKTSDGRRIVVELQKRRQANFQDRTLYYATWPIQAQGKKGKWDYGYHAVHVITILDFLIGSIDDDDRIIRSKKILDTVTYKAWTSSLVIHTVEIARFKKKRKDCHTLQEKWFFVLRNLHKLMEKPVKWQEEVFSRLFEVSDKTRFNESVLATYEESEKELFTMKNALDYAIREGREEGKLLGIEEGRQEGRQEGRFEGKLEGLMEGKMETVERMIAKGFDWATIREITSLSQAEFEKWKAKK